MNQHSLIVFDVDGVLVDVSRSYNVAVQRTAALFFEGAAGGPLPDPIFPLSDLAAIQRTGGLNNDWDLSRLVIELMASQVKPMLMPTETDPWQGYKSAIAACDIGELARLLSSSDSPLQELLRTDSNPNKDFVGSCYRGDVGSGNIIKQIFQELYLGSSLFQATYGIAPRVHQGEGLNANEALLVDPDDLESLRTSHVLAVATGRTRLETDYVLDLFQIRDCFTAICNHDDCVAAAASSGESLQALLKPNPYMLDRIASEVPDTDRRCYVGDLPDDMVAASSSSAGYRGIGLTATSSDPDQLRAMLLQSGADTVATTVAELFGLLKSA